MGADAILSINRAALDYDRARLEAAARNIAQANVPLSPGAPATLHRAQPAMFGELLSTSGMGAASLSEQSAPTRAVHDPDHPMADERGNVHFTAVDVVGEMTTMLTASRSYEANVRAVNLLRGMVVKGLEIGGRQ